jgi:hypothetical protein
VRGREAEESGKEAMKGGFWVCDGDDGDAKKGNFGFLGRI